MARQQMTFTLLRVSRDLDYTIIEIRDDFNFFTLLHCFCRPFFLFLMTQLGIVKGKWYGVVDLRGEANKCNRDL